MNFDIRFLFFAMLLISSCGHVDSGGSRSVTISSLQTNASVLVYSFNKKSLERVGETPHSIDLTNIKIGEVLFLQVEKEGYVPQSVSLEVGKKKIYDIQVDLKKLEKWDDSGQVYAAKLINTFSVKQNKINYLIKKKDYLEALKIVKNLAEQYPKASALYSMEGSIHLLRGDNLSAINYYNKALTLSPEDTQVKKMIEKLQKLRN